MTITTASPNPNNIAGNASAGHAPSVAHDQPPPRHVLTISLA
jgi:hypothetical protein